MTRFSCGLFLLLVPAVALGQTPEEKAATLKYIASLRDADTAAYKVTADGKPSLRACNGAVKAIKCLGGEVTEKEKLTKFVLGCYDPKTGAFAEPGGQPDVPITAVGVMVACELDIPKEKFKGAMGFLEKHATQFEEMRIAAAAVEAFGVKESGVDVTPWVKAASTVLSEKTVGPRDVGSAAALKLRLGVPLTKDETFQTHLLVALGQEGDGGWKKTGAKASDIETTYRLMRCLTLMKESPDFPKKVREFVATHRNKDGGYATAPGEASSMSGVYYAAVISKWLDEMAKK